MLFYCLSTSGAVMFLLNFFAHVCLIPLLTQKLQLLLLFFPHFRFNNICAYGATQITRVLTYV